jgi:hypothetical protein
MDKKRGWPELVMVAFATTLLLLVPYIGAYYATVRVGLVFHNVSAWEPPRLAPHDVQLPPHYNPTRICGIDADAIFAPVHAIDRRLRPKTWVRIDRPEIPAAHFWAVPESQHTIWRETSNSTLWT